jgi:hypothetical protein
VQMLWCGSGSATNLWGVGHAHTGQAGGKDVGWGRARGRGEGGTWERGGRIMGDSCGPDEMVPSARPPHRSAYMYQVENVCLGGG